MKELSAEADVAGRELQKASTAYMSSGDTQRLKDTNQFRNTLVRAENDFRTAVARLEGEAAPTSGRAMGLEATPRLASGFSTTVVAREATRPPDSDKRQEYTPFAQLNEAQKAETRRRNWLLGICVSCPWRPAPGSGTSSRWTAPHVPQ